MSVRRTVTVSVSQDLHPRLFEILFGDDLTLRPEISASGFFIQAALLKIKEMDGQLIDVGLFQELAEIKELIANIQVSGFTSAIKTTSVKLDSTELL